MYEMTYDIARMRAELNRHIAPFLDEGPIGELISESFGLMRESDMRLSGRLPSSCLIPRNDGNGRIVVNCGRATANSHAIQNKVLRSIASGTPPRVLDYMDVDTPRIARECQGPDGRLWHKLPWNIERMSPQPVSPGSASARHFACNSCDNKIFQDIEDKAIDWPTWPETLVIDDLESNASELFLSRQMFLLAYRCLLQHISQIQGLIAAEDYAATNNRRISSIYHRALRTRQSLSQDILQELHLLKSRYDDRLTDVATMPMVHHIVAVEPGFTLASTGFDGTDYRPIATTVYPEPVKSDPHSKEWHHWLVISAELAHVGQLEPSIRRKVEAAQKTVNDARSSIEWTVEHVIDTGCMSTFGNPESYDLFSRNHPRGARRIESHVPNIFVAECYERSLGYPYPGLPVPWATRTLGYPYIDLL